MRLLLVLGATMRLTRFIITDDLGSWLIKAPARRWANYAEQVPDPAKLWSEDILEEAPDPDAGWRSKIVSGLDCPFCVGFWVGALVLLSYAIVGKTRLWKFVAGVFSLNEVAAHLGSRLGDAGYED